MERSCGFGCTGCQAEDNVLTGDVWPVMIGCGDVGTSHCGLQIGTRQVTGDVRIPTASMPEVSRIVRNVTRPTAWEWGCASLAGAHSDNN